MQKQIEEIKDCIDSVYGCDCAYFDVDGLAIADAIYNACYRKQEWISVEERLPENEKQVLVYGMRGRVCVCRYESRYDKCFNYIKTGFYRNEDKKFMNVRYWMPLPEPPKGVAE